MFDYLDIGPSLLHLLMALLRIAGLSASEGGDPDETEVEPDP